MSEEKMNCWEFFKCGREATRRHGSDPVCAASVTSSRNGINDGVNAGRSCWKVMGTFCTNHGVGNVRGTIDFKETHCQQCDFRRYVMEQEGEDFQE